MATTAAVFPGTVSQGATAAPDWAVPNNIKVQDSVTSVVVLVAQVSEFLYATNFDFSSVPLTALITGFTVTYWGNAAAASGEGYDETIQLVQNSTTLIGTNQALGTRFANLGIQAFVISGTFGTSGLLGSDVRSSTFGVALRVTATDTVGIDAVSMAVSFTGVSMDNKNALIRRNNRLLRNTEI